ncbi:Rap1 GTPase-GDP dissociation stimulator 1 [Tupaia chinensis]|uniref:Rap1 GTPase-GDP dissociation stimulator 1 n=1 Tax=Tupaia chinensis TaxID=246437 RepID=L9JEW9_TUPCH|nr:Rap1 GTPase-GDP dissociation stimulator 1 [Tupaia chinensis]
MPMLLAAAAAPPHHSLGVPPCLQERERDESMQKLFEGGKDNVFQRVLPWIPSNKHQLPFAGALAIANFARNDGNCIHMVDNGIVEKLISLLDRYRKDGNVTVLARYQWKNYRYVLAFYFAIEQINKSPHLLPNLSLGYDFYNALPSDKRTLESALFLLTGGYQSLPNYNCQIQKQPVAILAGNMPTFSAQVGTLLELYKSPQVTYGPFDPILSDKDQFPSVYQMATKDSSSAYGIICLLLHFGWTWVALYVSDDMQGEQFLQDVKAKMIEKVICVAFTEKLPAQKVSFYIVTSML